MEATKIKVGDRLAFTLSSRPKSYSGRLEVEVLDKLNVAVPDGGRYTLATGLKELHNVQKVYLHQGKSHYIVQAIERDQRWIVPSSHLPETWDEYQGRIGGAKHDEDEAFQVRAQARIAHNERAEGLVENLQALGFVSARWGGETLLLSLDDAESVLTTVLEVIQ